MLYARRRWIAADSGNCCSCLVEPSQLSQHGAPVIVDILFGQPFAAVGRVNVPTALLNIIDLETLDP